MVLARTPRPFCGHPLRPLPPFALPLLALAFGVACKKDATAARTADGRQEIAITVDAVGYHPAESHAKAGDPVRLVVTRTTDDGCGQELVVPSLKLKRELPLKQPVNIDLTMPAKGAVAFECGMGMMHGSIVAD
jgi:plastocyanin domain-containing protein